MLRERRSASQVLFGFLPEQTVDLRGRVWRVEKWVEPIRAQVDVATLRHELLRQAAPWSRTGRDGGYANRLYRSEPVAVLGVNRDQGVKVEAFPNVWTCKRCDRVQTRGPDQKCHCGGTAWGQLPFVHYHRCGALREPWIKTCDVHHDVKVVFPGTASAAELRFECPVCRKVVRRGFGFPRCECGDGQMQVNVHRTAAVYTPRTVVVVNPPTPERMRSLERLGGAPRALGWVVEGMSGRWIDAGSTTRDAFRQQLLDQGIPPDMADSFVEQAVASGSISGGAQDDVEILDRAEAESQAVTVALALAESRLTIGDLLAGEQGLAGLGDRYRSRYLPALADAGLEEVELADRFPVLTGSFGYTRGGIEPGEATLVPFRDRRGALVVHGEVNETEALFVRLRPATVAAWLRRQGFALPPTETDSAARRTLLGAVQVPGPGDDPNTESSGAALLRLLHSYSHWFIRRAAVFAGIDRNSLGELLVPLHCGFFVFAAARGDFVLGGLQALFETELDALLGDLVTAEQRCALDPGCERAGGACMACMHLGEPSCRYYNQFLSRRTMFGELGYLHAARSQVVTTGGDP